MPKTKPSAKKEDLRLIEDMLANKLEPDSTYNLPDKLPFYYHKVSPDGTVKWACSHGPDGEIMSVYEFIPDSKDKAKQYREDVLKDFEMADKLRNTHIEEGWEPTQIPAMKFNMSDKPLNREQRRKLAKVIVAGKYPETKPREESKTSETSAREAVAPEWKYSDEEDSDSF